MVNVVIMRHGEAQALAADDRARTLTSQGCSDVQQMALWLATTYAAFDYVWVSPYTRTRETAELILSSQPSSTQSCIMSELVPEGSVAQVQQQVDSLLAEQPHARVLLISHMPLVSFLVEAFTQPGQMPIFSPAALYCIDYEPSRGGKLLERNSPLEMRVC